MCSEWGPTFEVDLVTHFDFVAHLNHYFDKQVCLPFRTVGKSYDIIDFWNRILLLY